MWRVSTAPVAASASIGVNRKKFWLLISVTCTGRTPVHRRELERRRDARESAAEDHDPGRQRRRWASEHAPGSGGAGSGGSIGHGRDGHGVPLPPGGWTRYDARAVRSKRRTPAAS